MNTELRIELIRRELTHGIIAARAGLSRSAVTRTLSGSRRNPDTIELISRAAGFDVRPFINSKSKIQNSKLQDPAHA